MTVGAGDGTGGPGAGALDADEASGAGGGADGPGAGEPGAGGGAALSCPRCTEPAPAGANWCEACGADLAAGPTALCVACGVADISADGYCMSCGHKQPTGRDRVEVTEGRIAAISDRGRRHHHNEDAVAVGTAADAGPVSGGGTVLVVCDGVSSTPGSAEASQVAAEAARDVLVAGLAAGSPHSGGGHGDSDEPADGDRPIDDRPIGDRPIDDLLLAATGAAQTEAARLGAGAVVASIAPSSTFVAAVARPSGATLRLSAVWLGDSRAYWVGPSGATQLTSDHERQGSLTRWLGADAVGVSPDIVNAEVAEPGLVLVCSDGLWRYADPPSALHELITYLANGPADAADPHRLASDLVAHALDGGGHDNISVAVWPWSGPGERVQNQAKETR